MTDDDLRELWREHGGELHGPFIETGYMVETKLLPFLRGMATNTADVHLWVYKDYMSAQCAFINFADGLLSASPVRKASESQLIIDTGRIYHKFIAVESWKVCQGIRLSELHVHRRVDTIQYSEALEFLRSRVSAF